MSNEPHADQRMTSPSGHPDNGHADDLQAECECLRRRVQELELQHEHDQRRMVALEAERDLFRDECLAWARKHFERHGLDPEQLKRQLEREDGVPLAAFIHELEQITNGK